MAPALTRVLKDGHGVHLSSPLVPVRPDSHLQLQLKVQAEPRVTPPTDLQQVWLSLPLRPPTLLPSPAPILLPPPSGPCLSPQVVLVLPAAPDTGRHIKEACVWRRERAAAPQSEPDGVDVLGSASSGGPPPLAWLQRHPRGSAAAAARLSRQAELQGRARWLQQRLHGVLGELAVRHCGRQLQALSQSLPDPGDPSRPPPAGPAPEWRREFPAAAVCEIREFSRSSRAALWRLQADLDPDATDSSGSEDENIRGGGASGRSSERSWLQQRAELGSRWSWLQVRLAALDAKIQETAGLHTHLRAAKGGVRLAEAQPMTDRQIQQSLLREVEGLTCTTSDADMEPCSLTRLLCNIERQSAQLSHIVNSLMPPHSLSPPAKQPPAWRSRRAYTSSVRGGDEGPSRRRRFRAELSCVCARTRPLLTSHRPKLVHYHSGPQGPAPPSTGCLREGWSMKPLLSDGPAPELRRCRHKLSRIRPGSPDGRAGVARGRHSRTNQRERKRSCIYKAHAAYHHGNEVDGLDEVLEKVSCKQISQGVARKCRREREHCISGAVTPPKAKRLQYKDILTPRWRVVDLSQKQDGGEGGDGGDGGDGEAELVSDEAFAQRHSALEQKEKLSWSCWARGARFSRPTRSGGGCTSGEESWAVWSSAQLQLDEKPRSEKRRRLQAPWEPRAFPLTRAEERALLFDGNLVLRRPLLDTP